MCKPLFQSDKIAVKRFRIGSFIFKKKKKKKIKVDFYILLLLNRYSLLSSRLTALMSHVILNEWLYPVIVRFSFNIHRSYVLTALFGCCMAGATWNCCHLGTSSVYTIEPRTSLQCHFIQSHISRVHVCWAVTCHLHFWQNEQDLLHDTAVTRGWNGYWNKSQHRKLTPEKKILPLFLPGLEPKTFWHHESISLPLSHPCPPHLR